MTRPGAPFSIATVAALAMLGAACSADVTSTASPVPTTATRPTPTTVAATAAPATATSATGASTAMATGSFAPGRHVVTFAVDGVQRVAIVVVPANLARPAPLVFVFHGHGGTGANIERKFDIEGLWPQAIVAYPYGLAGHKGRTDPKGVERGWQTRAGESGDRDLRFYDVMLATLRSHLPVDPQRIYAMGHSNGSAFVSLLLNRRGSAIAATANLSGQPSAHQLATDPTRSMFMAMGMTDPLVPYANQKRAIPLAEHKLGADPAQAKVVGDLTSVRGRGRLELEVYVYPGGHEPPPIVPRLVVAFFGRHTLAGG